jgi:MFS family permease
MGVPAGLLLSTGVFALLSAALSEAEFLAWGWRLPFLASALLVVVGMFIRLRILESPAFVRLKAESRTHARPIVELVRTHRRSILLAAGMRVAENGTFYVFTVFVLSYGEHELRLPRALLLDGVLMAAAAGLAAIPLYGALSDRIGRRRVIMAGALFTLLFAFPFFRLLETRRPLFVQLAIMLAVNLGHDPMYGPQAAFFSELFGAGVRYSGASLSYQLTSVVTGGLAPFIATLLLARAGTSAVAAYMAVMSAITLASAWLAEETCGRDLPDSEEVEPPPLSRIGS